MHYSTPNHFRVASAPANICIKASAARSGRFGVGERFNNADGSSRQHELARCKPGEALNLRREPGNPRDSRAIAVYSCRAVQLGYLSRAHADWFAPMLDRGASAAASVVTVAPRGRPFSPLALTLRLSLCVDEPR
jgi:hypothetical protein